MKNADTRVRWLRSRRALAAVERRDPSKPTYFQVDSIPPPIEGAPQRDEPPCSSHHDDLRVLTARAAERPVGRLDPDLVVLGGGLFLDQPLLRLPSVPRDLAALLSDGVGKRASKSKTRYVAAGGTVGVAVVVALALARGSSDSRTAAMAPHAAIPAATGVEAAMDAPMVGKRREEPAAPAARGARRPEEGKTVAAGVRERANGPQVSTFTARQRPMMVEPPKPGRGAPPPKPSPPPQGYGSTPSSSASACDLACLMQRAVAPQE